MKENNLMKCPFCDSEINEFNDKQKQILRNDINSKIILALIHDSHHDLDRLYITNHNLKDVLVNSISPSKLKGLYSDQEESLKRLSSFFSTLRELLYPNKYSDKVVPILTLYKKIDWLRSIFHNENKINYSSLINSDIKINIDEYWNLFMYAFHCLNFSVRRSRNPDAQIDLIISDQILLTKFTLNQDKTEFDSNENWLTFINLCKSLNSNPSIRSDANSTIIQWYQPLINL